MLQIGDDNKEADEDDDDKEEEEEKDDGSGDCNDLVDAKVNCCWFIPCCLLLWRHSVIHRPFNEMSVMK